jgi:hypothetical protein
VYLIFLACCEGQDVVACRSCHFSRLPSHQSLELAAAKLTLTPSTLTNFGFAEFRLDMAPIQPAAKLEREKKLKAIFGECCAPADIPWYSPYTAFGSSLTKRIENERNASLINDLQTQIRGLPLQPSSTLIARQDELDRLGTELWNLSTRVCCACSRSSSSTRRQRKPKDVRERAASGS